MAREDRIFWIVMVSLLLLTRIPAAAQYLSIDNVNLAFALERFDPRIHQPQPPGYPFFVGAARLFNVVFRDAERTFEFVSILVSVLCLPVVFALGKRMFAPWVGRAAAFLLLVNPVFWQTGLDGPLRPNLALFSLLTAYCAWRCWNGERAFIVWGACALAVGSGFRPDLAAFLFPLWLVSSWIATRSIGDLCRGLLAMVAIVAVWVAALAWAVGGAGALMDLTMNYLIDQSRTGSVVLGASEGGWLRQISRLVIWNGLAVVGWLWAIPFFLRCRDRVALTDVRSAFFALWLAPGLLLQAFIHVAAPGHTLFSVPALCLIGAYVIYVAIKTTEIRDIAFAGTLIVNVMLFLNYVPLPPPGEPASGLASLKNAMVFGTFEASLGDVRYIDDISRGTLNEIKRFTPNGRRYIIVTTDVQQAEWFMNWRMVRYYLPRSDIWVVADQQTPKMALRVRRDRTLEVRNGSPVTVPIPKGGRVLWLLGSDTPFYKELIRNPVVPGGQHILYTDVDADTRSFRVLDFEFVPTDTTSSSGDGISGIQ